MPILLNNPAHWHLRAQEARLLASQLEDSEAKAATLKIADEYDRLAVRVPRGPTGEKRPADVIGAAVLLALPIGEPSLQIQASFGAAIKRRCHRRPTLWHLRPLPWTYLRGSNRPPGLVNLTGIETNSRE
jgi:hypothetical protein